MVAKQFEFGHCLALIEKQHVPGKLGLFFLEGMFSRNISEILQRLFAFSKSWSADFCTNFIPMLVPYITVYKN